MRQATWWAGWVAALMVMASLAGAMVRADDAKVSGDLKKMQGTWINASDDGPEARWVFEGETLRATVNGQDYTCTVSLDPNARPHSTADFVIKEGAGDSAGKTSKGIYKFQGERLIICVTLPGIETRPTEFQTVQDEAHLFELKKEN